MGWVAILALLLIWAVAVAVTDWRLRKVPNLLLLAVLLPAGAALAWRGEGLIGANLIDSLLGLLTGTLLGVPGYVASRFGAGDVKLMATLGFLQGVESVLMSILLAALLLGLMSLVVVSRLGPEAAGKVRLPAAVALSGGFIGALMVSHWGAL